MPCQCLVLLSLSAQYTEYEHHAKVTVDMHMPSGASRNVSQVLNTLRPRQNGRHFPDDIFKWIFLNENVFISIKISLKFVPNGQINNIPALV